MKRTSSSIAGMLIVAAVLFAAPSLNGALGAENVKIMLPGPSTAFAPLYHA